MGKFVTKLTPTIRQELVEYLKRGHYKRSAAALVGIHRDTLEEWERRGAKAKEIISHPPLRDDYLDEETFEQAELDWKTLVRRERPYAELADATQQAYDYGEGWLMEQILEAADPATKKTYQKRWQAYMTILERSRRDRWSRRSITEYGNADGKPFEVSHSFDPSKLSLDELEQLKLLLDRARPDDQ